MILSDTLDTTWKEVHAAYFKLLSSIHMEDQKTPKCLDQDSPLWARIQLHDLNRKWMS